MALTLVLNDFSGPLDLLWHLIHTNEVDIYDIPIAQITSQYLAYLHEMQELRLDIAGDYFVLAASLMALKSKLLLPQVADPVNPEDDDYTDPRADLVAQLLTYQVYQEAAGDLRQRESKRALSYAKAETLPPDDVVVPIHPGAIKLNELTAAMAAIMKRQLATAQTIAHIEAEPVSLKQRIAAVLEQLSLHKSCLFTELLADRSVDGVVTTFLALLELMKDDAIVCEQDEPNANITVMKKEAV